MKKNLQMLALGFLISAVVLFIGDQFFITDTDAATETKTTQKATETKADSSKKDSDNSDTWKKKYEDLLAQQELEKKEAEDAKKAEEAKANEVKTYTLTIQSGDPASKAGEDLQANGIIESADDFNKYIKDNGYEGYIRDGQYEVKSDMSYEDIAKLLSHR
ncbi:endolytic transglycosylase MltG [Listeria costaricensis]|uniref:endolytic transglycosylase MltG n=1 Tax=Listeria costaricensis TaxID=2026604 RepID=UPI000C0873B6|nr:endolytic transglycosylase MltG [Listeria costaricensis]